MEDYRISKSREEIIKSLEKKFKASGVFTIWQKNASGEREFVVEAKLNNFNQLEGYFSLTIPEEKFSKADVKGDFYFLLQGHEFVFKSRMAIDQVKGEYRFQFPKEVRLKELRIHPRKYFEQDEKISVGVVFKTKNTDQKEEIESNCPVLNISSGGLCIVVSKETLSEIDLSKEIEVSGLSFYDNLKPEMTAIVRNARVHIKKNIKNDDYYALGLQFQGPAEK